MLTKHWLAIPPQLGDVQAHLKNRLLGSIQQSLTRNCFVQTFFFLSCKPYPKQCALFSHNLVGLGMGRGSQKYIFQVVKKLCTPKREISFTQQLNISVKKPVLLPSIVQKKVSWCPGSNLSFSSWLSQHSQEWVKTKGPYTIHQHPWRLWPQVE